MNMTDTTPKTTTEEPKLDFEAAAAEVWKAENPPVQETIAPATDEASGEPKPAPEERPAEPAKDERVAARIAAAKRAEQTAARERERIKSEAAALEAKQKEIEAREKRVKIIEEDPVRFFEEFKQDPKTFLDKLAGEYKPEAVVDKKVKALEAELAQLKADAQKRETDQQTAAQRAQADEAWRVASAQFVQHVETSAEKYPSLVEEFTEAEATDLAFKVLTEVVGRTDAGQPITRAQAYYAEFGAYPDDDVVAEHLDKLAKQRIEGRAKSGWRRSGEAAKPSSELPSGDPKPVPPVSGMSPRTLKARDASTRAAPPKVWTQEAADEESIRLISAAMRKQA